MIYFTRIQLKLFYFQELRGSNINVYNSQKSYVQRFTDVSLISFLCTNMATLLANKKVKANFDAALTIQISSIVTTPHRRFCEIDFSGALSYFFFLWATWIRDDVYFWIFYANLILISYIIILSLSLCPVMHCLSLAGARNIHVLLVAGSVHSHNVPVRHHFRPSARRTL